CLIFDICMPGMSGIELAHHLLSQDRVPTIIFLTGYGDIPTAVETIRKGAVNFIEKPFLGPKLINCINEAIVVDRENWWAHLIFEEVKGRQATLSTREHEVMDL